MTALHRLPDASLSQRRSHLPAVLASLFYCVISLLVVFFNKVVFDKTADKPSYPLASVRFLAKIADIVDMVSGTFCFRVPQDGSQSAELVVSCLFRLTSKRRRERRPPVSCFSNSGLFKVSETRCSFRLHDWVS